MLIRTLIGPFHDSQVRFNKLASYSTREKTNAHRKVLKSIVGRDALIQSNRNPQFVRWGPPRLLREKGIHFFVISLFLFNNIYAHYLLISSLPHSCFLISMPILSCQEKTRQVPRKIQVEYLMVTPWWDRHLEFYTLFAINY